MGHDIGTVPAALALAPSLARAKMSNPQKCHDCHVHYLISIHFYTEQFLGAKQALPQPVFHLIGRSYKDCSLLFVYKKVITYSVIAL